MYICWFKLFKTADLLEPSQGCDLHSKAVGGVSRHRDILGKISEKYQSSRENDLSGLHRQGEFKKIV